MTIPVCDGRDGCARVQRNTDKLAEHDRRFINVEEGVDAVHKRIDGLMVLIIVTLASSLTAAGAAVINLLSR